MWRCVMDQIPCDLSGSLKDGQERSAPRTSFHSDQPGGRPPKPIKSTNTIHRCSPILIGPKAIPPWTPPHLCHLAQLDLDPWLSDPIRPPRGGRPRPFWRLEQRVPHQAKLFRDPQIQDTPKGMDCQTFFPLRLQLRSFREGGDPPNPPQNILSGGGWSFTMALLSIGNFVEARWSLVYPISSAHAKAKKPQRPTHDEASKVLEDEYESYSWCNT